MNPSSLVILAASLVATSHALAEDGETLARKNNCMICHAVAGKSAGPSFKDIAGKYRNIKDAQAALEKKVRNGGSGVWGSMPMPPTRPSVSDADIRSMVQWMLAIE